MAASGRLSAAWTIEVDPNASMARMVVEPELIGIVILLIAVADASLFGSSPVRIEASRYAAISRADIELPLERLAVATVSSGAVMGAHINVLEHLAPNFSRFDLLGFLDPFNRVPV
jgi:hypothetical protein